MKYRYIILFILIFTSSPIIAMEFSLQQAEMLAVESSKAIRNSREQIMLAALGNKFGLRNFLPQLELNYNNSHQTNLYAPDSETIQLGVIISQPIFDGGKTIKKQGLSKIQLEIQSAVLDQQIEDIHDQVRLLFFQLILNREKLELQQELLDISIEQLSITAKKFEIGSLTELDYLETAVEVQGMRIDILDTESQELSLKFNIAQLLGFEPDIFETEELVLTGSVDREYKGLNLTPGDSAEYLEIALGQSLEFRQKEANLYQQMVEYELLKSSLMPQLILETSVFFRGSQLPLQEPGCSFSLKIGFPFDSVPADVSFSGSSVSRTQHSDAAGISASLLPDLDFIVNEKSSALKLKQAAEGLDDYSASLKKSIRESLEKLEHQRFRLDIRRSTQDLLKKRLKILETKTRQGEVRDIDLLQARIDYYKEEISIREGVLELILNERNFEKLIGLKSGESSQISSKLNGENND